MTPNVVDQGGKVDLTPESRHFLSVSGCRTAYVPSEFDTHVLNVTVE